MPAWEQWAAPAAGPVARYATAQPGSGGWSRGTTRELEGFRWRCMADPEGNEFDIDVLPWHVADPARRGRRAYPW